jgi:hypothetical protein
MYILRGLFKGLGIHDHDHSGLFANRGIMLISESANFPICHRKNFLPPHSCQIADEGLFESSLCQSCAEKEFFGCLSASFRWSLGLVILTMNEQSRQFKQLFDRDNGFVFRSGESFERRWDCDL